MRLLYAWFVLAGVLTLVDYPDSTPYRLLGGAMITLGLLKGRLQ